MPKGWLKTLTRIHELELVSCMYCRLLYTICQTLADRSMPYNVELDVVIQVVLSLLLAQDICHKDINMPQIA